jgi:agmatine deiminase
MKAEFELHKCTVLLYPERKDVWRKGARQIKETVEHLAETIVDFEPVFLGHNKNNIPKLMSSRNLKLFNIEYDDIWVRDTGPVPVDSDNLAAFGFDAWSGLYGDFKKDSAVAEKVGQLFGVKPEKSKLVLEGGNLSCDGNGTLLAIKESIQKRNPISLEEIEEELKHILKIKQIIWLEQGLVYDETGGHVDNLCVFADKNTIMLSWTNDKDNPQYPIVKQAFETLKNAKDADGKEYTIVKVPVPDIFFRTEEDCDEIELFDDSKNRLVGEPIQASYINFAFANGVIVVPQFGLKQDEETLKIFRNIFSLKTVIPFDAREIVLGGGGVHCITRNI